MQPVELRENYYNALFAGELPYEPLPPEAQVGISGLARLTFRAGVKSPELNAHLENIPAIVRATLEEQDGRATTDAIFCFVDTANRTASESRALVGGVTASILTQWEITCARRGLERLLDGENGRGLVVETAAAVTEVATPYNGLSIDSSRDRATIVRLLASWGPRFARQWFSRSIMNEWAAQNEMDADEIEAMHDVFKPYVLREFVDKHIKDPLGGLERLKNNLDTVLNDSNIADLLGWSTEEVQEVFQKSFRLRLALSYPKDPLVPVRKVQRNLEEVLTDDNIAQYLGWEAEDAARWFTPGVRRQFAFANINDPLSALNKVRDNLSALTDERIAAHLGWGVERVADVFTEYRKRRLASRIGDPFITLTNIGNNLDSIFTVENVARQLGCDEEVVGGLIKPSDLVNLAFGYPANPTQALDKIRDNIEQFTDDRIAEYLGWSARDVAEVFTPDARRTFAVRCINDPFKGCKSWAEGRSSLNYSADRSLRHKLAQRASRPTA